LLFRKLEAVVSADCAICVRCVTENPGGVINEVSSSERFVGINFAEFIKASPVAEIARFEKTTDAVLDTVVGYSKRIGWEPLIGRHSPGMVINRIAAMYMLTGINMLEKGKGFVPEIDAAVREHMKVPMGPFELADYVGLDSFFNFNTYLYKALSQPDRFLPSKTVDRLSQYGETGRKCGIGFYIHDDGKLAGVNPRLPDIVKYLGLSGCSPRNIFADMAGAISAEAKLCAVDAQVSEYDVENAVRSALKWPKGPSSLAREAAIS
ncbi:MAG: 3-hydroxyacyl-CoA dehydrogenase family protein, partial [Elusimicrobiaceae bacterium]